MSHALKNNCDQEGRSGVFATTRWTLVLNASTDSREGREALDSLCQTYWPSVYALIRRRGHSPESARDLTQSFFDHLLSGNLLSGVRRERGRFRSYLSQSIRNFLADEWDKAQAKKRGSGALHFSIAAEAAERTYQEFLEAPETLSPERVFLRQWAEGVLASARRRLEEEFAASGKSELLRLLDQTGEPGAAPLAREAERLGIPVNTLKSHLHRTRNRYGEVIREVIAETVSTPLEVEAELRELLAAVSE